MKTIIAGSRDLINPVFDIADAVRGSGFDITEVTCGCARGADIAGWCWARAQGHPVAYFPAWWSQAQWAMDASKGTNEVIHYSAGGYNKGAGNGFIRNRLMAEYADALIAIWDGQSRGTQHMIATAKAVGIKVYVHYVKEGESGE